MKWFWDNSTSGGRVNPPSPTVRRLGNYRGAKYWQEQGWKIRHSGLMEGYYRTFYGSYKGDIELFDSGKHQFFIYKPPPQLSQHPHWPCFMYRGNTRYWVHFKVEAENVDTGIITIEKIIHEAIELYR